MADKIKDKPPGLFGGLLNFPVPPEKKASEFLNAYSTWIYSAVTKIARELSNVNLRLYKKKYIRNKLEIEEVTEHEALSLLYNVNEFTTKTILFEITQTYLELTGEAAWLLLRDNITKKPNEIWVLRPDWISVKPSKDFIDYYIYRVGGALTADGTGINEIKIPKEDLIFFKYSNPINPYRGLGVVKAGASVIDIDTFSDDFNRTFFYNSALPSLFFTTDQKLGREEIERFYEMWRSKFQGRLNSHKVAFLGGGLEPKPIGGNIRDLEFLEGKKFLRDEILAMFHVSKANIGIVEDVNRANQEATDNRFAKTVLKPRMVSLIAYLNEFYLRNWENEDLFFDFDDPVSEDPELKLKLYENALKNGWMSINEVREKENLEPIDGGDIIYLPFSLQPIGEDRVEPNTLQRIFKLGKSPEPIFLKAKRKINKYKFNLPIPPKRLKTIREEQIKDGIRPMVYKMVANLMKLQTDIKKKDKKDEMKEGFWRSMVAKTDVLEQKMKTHLVALWDDQETKVKNNIADYYKKSIKIKTLSDFLFDENEENGIWIRIFKPFVRNTVEDKAREIFDFLGEPRQLNTHTVAAKRFLEKQGLLFISQVNSTTIERLRKTLGEGLLKGEGIDKLSERVTEIYNTADENRAELIARTEVLQATNFATEEAYKQSGIVKGKEWLTAIDERTCSYCNEMDGKVIELTKNYYEDGDNITTEEGTFEVNKNISYPPLHPNCRCTLIPVL